MEGLFNTFCLLYLSEASPPHLRGGVVAGFQLFLVAGSVIGAVVDNYTAVRVDRLSYQIPLIVLYAVPVLLTLLILWLPDSPRWLIENGRVDDSSSKGEIPLKTSSPNNWLKLMLRSKQRKRLEKSLF
jgi:MFS family permease